MHNAPYLYRYVKVNVYSFLIRMCDMTEFLFHVMRNFILHKHITMEFCYFISFLLLNIRKKGANCKQ